MSGELDFQAIDQLEEHFARGPGWAWLGDLAHPHNRLAGPSRVDCEGWISRARASRIDVVLGLYAGLIITPPVWGHFTVAGWPPTSPNRQPPDPPGASDRRSETNATAVARRSEWTSETTNIAAASWRLQLQPLIGSTAEMARNGRGVI